MAKVVLSKSGLQKERENLKLYRKVLPSLDLKRRQLMGEQKKAEHELEAMEDEFTAFPEKVARELPMLAADAVDLTGLVTVKEFRTGIENVVGVKLPILEAVDFEMAAYSLLGRPHWVDLAVKRLRDYAELKARHDVARERVETLRQAARKITQRVNLFEKILIPQAETNIKRIQIFLADAERAAVVQSKIAKTKGRKRREETQDDEEETS